MAKEEVGMEAEKEEVVGMEAEKEVVGMEVGRGEAGMEAEREEVVWVDMAEVKVVEVMVAARVGAAKVVINSRFDLVALRDSQVLAHQSG